MLSFESIMFPPFCPCYKGIRQHKHQTRIFISYHVHSRRCNSSRTYGCYGRKYGYRFCYSNGLLHNYFDIYILVTETDYAFCRLLIRITMNNYTVMIMAGGSGERFWPLSTKETPKQLLKLIDNQRSLIRMTVDRVLPMIPAERIFIATNQIQARGISEELDIIPPENIIIEPAFKDTAAAIGHACIVIDEVYPHSTMVVLASDHLIKNEQAFRTNLMTAIELTEHAIYSYFRNQT